MNMTTPNGNHARVMAVAPPEPEFFFDGAEEMGQARVDPRPVPRNTSPKARPVEMQTLSNVEAEQAVLGSCLLDEVAFFRVELEAEYFFIERHRFIWKAMQALAADGIPIDFLTLTSKLQEQEKLEYVGGGAYLTSLLTAVPTAAHVEHYARLVKREATRRKLIEAATEVSELVYNESSGMDADELVGRAQEKFVWLREGNAPARSWDEMWEEYQGRLETFVEEKREFWGLSTGFVDIDRKVGGLEKGHLWIIAGDAGKGKTALAMQIAMNVAERAGELVYVFSLEMAWQNLMDRFVASLADVSARDLKRGRLNEVQLRELRERAAQRAGLPLIVDDRSSVTAQGTRAAIARLNLERKPVRVLVVDYSRYVKPRGQAGANARQDLVIKEVCAELRELAKDFGLTVILIHEKTKSTDEEPTLNNLKDGGAYEGDVVLMVGFKDRSRKDYVATDLTADIWVTKNRFGGMGHIPMLYDGEKTRWMCIAHENGQRNMRIAQERNASRAPLRDDSMPPWDDER